MRLSHSENSGSLVFAGTMTVPPPRRRFGLIWDSLLAGF
jgi:hypothetical protein